MRAGQLRNRVKLQKQLVEPDEFGAEGKIQLHQIGEFWAKVENGSSKKVRANGETIIETLLFTMRPNDLVEIDHQIIFNDKIFTIREIDRTKIDRIIITGEADSRHDRA